MSMRRIYGLITPLGPRGKPLTKKLWRLEWWCSITGPRFQNSKSSKVIYTLEPSRLSCLMHHDFTPRLKQAQAVAVYTCSVLPILKDMIKLTECAYPWKDTYSLGTMQQWRFASQWVGKTHDSRKHHLFHLIFKIQECVGHILFFVQRLLDEPSL